MIRWALSLAAVLWLAVAACACPFCTAVKPSLSQRREEAALALLVEVAGTEGGKIHFAIQKALGGAEKLADPGKLSLPTGELAGGDAIKPGKLALLLAMRGAEEGTLAWEVVPLDELSYSYVVRAPSRRLPAQERLGYYARFLEHANPLLAEDAYLEFGNAAYDEVAQVADRLPFADMRRWIVDPQVPESRKGFYGLALGLAKREEDRRANRELLERLIDAPADDFRSGFDGVLGGYLVLAGPAGLRHLDEKLLASPQAASGDIRHAATALRFIHEFGRGAILQADLARAMRRLLARPETAQGAIVDLGRWKDWEPLDEIAALFDRQDYADPGTSRAIVGYLTACPSPKALTTLAELRRRHPRRVAEAEQAGLLLPVRQ